MKRYCVIFTILFSVLYAGAVYASVSIDPLRVELAAEPGEKIEGYYTVTNTKDIPLKVTIQSKKSFTLEENKNIEIDDWITLSPRKFRIEAKGSKKVKYTITVPKKVEGFIMVLNSFIPNPLDEQGELKQEMLNTVFSIPVYVRIKDTERVSAEITKVEIAGDAKNLSVMVKVHNTGNTYVRPSGKIEIIYKKKTVGTIHLKEGWPVFPGKSESYQGMRGGFDLKSGKYTIIATLTCDAPAITIEKKDYFVVDRKGIVKKK